MASDIPSDVQALVVGGLFIFIGLSILTLQIPSGSPVNFIRNIGWAFIISGAISFTVGGFGIYERFRTI